MSDEPKGGRNRRRFTRVALDAQVKVKVPSTDSLFDSRIRDLSENGVFILMEKTRPIGTGLELDIVVREGAFLVRARGIIVHEVRPEDARPDRPAGIGVMFLEVEEHSQAQLAELVKQGKPLP